MSTAPLPPPHTVHVNLIPNTVHLLPVFDSYPVALPLLVKDPDNALVGYLGSPNQASDYEWMCFGDANWLLRKKDIDTYLTARSDIQACPDSIPCPPATILEAVVLIFKDNFLFMLCANWSRPRDGTQTFTQAWLGCDRQIPSHPLFAKQFKHVLINLEVILHKGCTAAVNAWSNMFLLVFSDPMDVRFRFSHKLFSKVDPLEIRPDTGKISIASLTDGV